MPVSKSKKYPSKRRYGNPTFEVVRREVLGEVELNPNGDESPFMAAMRLIDPSALEGRQGVFEFTIPDGDSYKLVIGRDQDE